MGYDRKKLYAIKHPNKYALSIVIYYSVVTLLPVALIILLHNRWYFIIIKVIAGIWLLSVLLNFFNNPRVLNLVGSAVAGFSLNIIFFVFPLFFYFNNIVVLILSCLIISILIVCFNIVKNTPKF